MKHKNKKILKSVFLFSCLFGFGVIQTVSLYAEMYNLFNNKPKPGFVLKQWQARIGSYSSKDSSAFYIPEYDIKNTDLTGLSPLEWNRIEIPFEFKRIEGESKLFSLSLLTEFSLKDLNMDPSKTLSLHIPFYQMNLEVYLNGTKIGEYGGININEQTYKRYDYRRHNIVKLPLDLLQENNELIIILYSVYPDMIRIDQVLDDIPLEINYFEEHQKIYNEVISFMLLFLYFFVGAYHLLLFVKRPKERYNLWFGLFSIALSLYYITRTTFVYNFLYFFNYVDTFLITKIEYSIIFSASLWAVLFFEEFHLNRLTLLSKILIILISFYALIIWFFSFHFASVILSYWQKTVLVIVLYTLGMVIYFAFWKKNQDSRRIIIGMVILAISIVLDVLGAMNIGLQNYQLARFGFFAFIIGIAFVLANKFLRVYREVEELNLHLEEKVKERTKELQESLNQIQKLKEQQDGDYFLTSLLIQPLMFISVHSEVVDVQSYLKQKKEFVFRKWQREIGGDMNIAQDIVLRNKPFVFIFNGDAMGKSLQGAGGALVIGVILKAILTRTLLYVEKQSVYPEKWLKELFIEIHKIFESFDGSMLMSGFLGLIDETTGTLYFIYAEHPYPVLYRNQRAEFLDNTTEFKKFGTPGLVGKISILVKKLEPNDILFIGSDGKDDLVLNVNGQEVVNEDETLFLRLVESASGDLNALVEKIKETGKIMDDISILRVSYKEGMYENTTPPVLTKEERINITSKIHNFVSLEQWKELKQYLEEINKKYYGIEFISRELINTYYKLEEYTKVISEGEQYLEAYPYNNDILYKVSRAYLITKNYEKALEYAERLDLRDPKHISNLYTLVNCYNLLDQKKKAVKTLNRLLELDGEREEAKKLRKIILGY